jgi:hypothetical protein
MGRAADFAIRTRIAFVAVAGLALGFTAACDGLVGLPSPGYVSEGGPDAQADGGGGVATFYAQGVAISSGSLYVLGGGGAGLYRVPLAAASAAPLPRWVPGASLTAIAAQSGSLYIAAAGNPNSIVTLNASSDEDAGLVDGGPDPTLVVDVGAALPGMNPMSVFSIASDGSSIFWTQIVNYPSTMLLRHDLGAPVDQAKVLYTASDTTGTLSQVAVDTQYVYVVSGSTLYAIPKDGGTALMVAQNGASPVLYDGVLYYVSNAALVHFNGPGGGSFPVFDSDPVGPFAIDDGGVLLFGSGQNLMVASIYTLHARTLLPSPATTQIAEVVAGGGYVGFYDEGHTVLGLVTEPSPP